MNNKREARGAYRIIGDWGGGVEHAVAALGGGAYGIVVEEVGFAEDQPLDGAVQRLQVSVLGIIYIIKYVKFKPSNTYTVIFLTKTSVCMPGFLTVPFTV
jgi:hypothetical protein